MVPEREHRYWKTDPFDLPINSNRVKLALSRHKSSIERSIMFYDIMRDTYPDSDILEYKVRRLYESDLRAYISLVEKHIKDSEHFNMVKRYIMAVTIIVTTVAVLVTTIG